ncbi:MAG: exodeoxyribonuclease III [Candidatus Moraniibacteriota bacterium]|nr:MAG: exodeoxyribonuclease III [Candidatus Moranbacteria bacterium]
MKIITWNVNGIRAVERKKELQNLLETYVPDVLFLQEIKGKREQFSNFLTKNEIYEQYYHSAEKPGYAGTGIWISREFLQNVSDATFDVQVPKAPNADEGRVSHVSFVFNEQIYDLLSIYFPNGGKSEKAWEEKLDFFDRVLEYMNELRNREHEVIVGGDMNVAHTEIDLARAKENDGNIGFHPRERAWMDRVLENDWADVWRTKNPKVTDVYSWWDMITRARERNVGWRIDYFFVDKNFVKKVSEIEYLNEQMGSDHCPLFMQIDV